MARLVTLTHAQSTIVRASTKPDVFADGSVPIALLPAQFFEHAVTAVPERRLMFAILLDAITHLQRRGSPGADEAKQWIRRDVGGPCSFRSVCEAVGIEPAYLARGLLAWDKGDEPRLPGSPVRRLRPTAHPRMTLRPRRRRVGRHAGPAMPAVSSALSSPS
jgi:hypothetical protein